MQIQGGSGMTATLAAVNQQVAARGITFTYYSDTDRY